MKIVIIDSDGCPFDVTELPHDAIAGADLIVERFAPFCPFIVKDRHEDSEIVEWRRRWEEGGSYGRSMYPLPATRSREEQEASHEAVIARGRT